MRVPLIVEATYDRKMDWDDLPIPSGIHSFYPIDCFNIITERHLKIYKDYLQNYKEISTYVK